MKCMYYLSPSLKETSRIADDLHSVGVSDWYLHIVSKDESGLKHQHLQTANYLEKLDLYHSGVIGGLIGACAGVLLVIFFNLIGLFAPTVPWWVNLIFIAVITLFGIWEGGLWGIDTENKKIRPFHDDIEAGKHLILIYTKAELESAVRHMMDERHPEVELVTVDRHWISPFSKTKKI